MEFQKIPNQHIWIRILRFRMQRAAEQYLINFDLYFIWAIYTVKSYFSREKRQNEYFKDV